MGLPQSSFTSSHASTQPRPCSAQKVAHVPSPPLLLIRTRAAHSPHASLKRALSQAAVSHVLGGDDGSEGGDGDGGGEGGAGGGEGGCGGLAGVSGCSEDFDFVSCCGSAMAAPSGPTHFERSEAEQQRSKPVWMYPGRPSPAHGAGRTSATGSAQKLSSVGEGAHCTATHVSSPYPSYRSMVIPSRTNGAGRPPVSDHSGVPVLPLGGCTTRKWSKPVASSKCHVSPADARTSASVPTLVKLSEHLIEEYSVHHEGALAKTERSAAETLEGYATEITSVVPAPIWMRSKHTLRGA